MLHAEPIARWKKECEKSAAWSSVGIADARLREVESAEMIVLRYIVVASPSYEAMESQEKM